jgi:hypothetical protein
MGRTEMMDEDAERRLTQMLEELGPADPPAGFVRQVMERVSVEDRQQIRGRLVPFHRGGIVMAKKAMWGVAAAAAVVLGVYTFTGFPPVDRGTEGTIGAAQKYQAPQIGEKDVVLGDADAQEFLQSETFDQLLKDPQARSLFADSGVRAQLANADFLRAIQSVEVRDALRSELLRNVLNNNEARAELAAQLSANLSAQAVNQAAVTAVRSAEARAAVAQLMSNSLMRQALSNSAVRVALLDRGFQASLMNQNLAAGLNNVAFVRAIQANGVSAALMNGGLAASLASR